MGTGGGVAVDTQLQERIMNDAQSPQLKCHVRRTDIANIRNGGASRADNHGGLYCW